MVYAAAFCPIAFKPTLETLGFDGEVHSPSHDLTKSDTLDSKALTAETRQSLWDAFEVHPDLCYSSSTLSPQDISANMLRRIPVNLNQQAQDATIGLIRDALDRGINVREVSSSAVYGCGVFLCR